MRAVLFCYNIAVEMDGVSSEWDAHIDWGNILDPLIEISYYGFYWSGIVLAALVVIVNLPLLAMIRKNAKTITGR